MKQNIQYKNNTKKIITITAIILTAVSFGYYVFLRVGSNNRYIKCSPPPDGLPWRTKIFSRVVFGSPPRLEPSLVTKSRLCFVNNPKINEPVEIVYEFKRGRESSSSRELVNATAKIYVPEGFEIISGNPTWKGKLAEGETKKISLIVKPLKLGYFRFRGSVMVGNITGSVSVLWTEISAQGGKIGSKPKNMWYRSDYIDYIYESDDFFIDPKDENIFGFQPGNFGKGHDPNIISSLALSNPLELGKESTLIYSVTPKIDLSENTQISLQLPDYAFDIINLENSPNIKIMQKDDNFIVWTGPINKGQTTEVRLRLKLKNYGWGNISARIMLSKYISNYLSESIVNDETVLNLYIDQYGKYASVLGDDLKSFNLSELHY